MTRSRRIMLTGAVYVALTALTKVVGLAREFLLLSEVGVGRHLDQFLLVFGLPNMLAAFVVPIVYYTSVRRTARLSDAIAQSTTEAGALEARRVLSAQFKRWGTESLVLSLGTFLVAAATNLIALYTLYPAGAVDTTSILVALFCAGTVLFSINSEYGSGVVTAMGAVGALVWCNVIINVPTVLYLLLFDVNIVTYSLIFALSFAARTAYLLLVIRRKTGVMLVPGRSKGLPPSADKYDFRVLYGSAITTASVFIFVAMRTVTSILPENSTTYYYYSLKIYDLYNTTIWFVVGAFFLSNIQNLPLQRVKRIASLHLVVNAALMVVAIALLQLLLSVLDQLPFQDILRQYSAHEILRLSMFAMPLVLFGPMLDLFQKVCATFAWHGRALTVAAVMTIGSFVFAAIGVALLHNVEGALIGTSVGFGLGLLVAMAFLLRSRA